MRNVDVSAFTSVRRVAAYGNIGKYTYYHLFTHTEILKYQGRMHVMSLVMGFNKGVARNLVDLTTTIACFLLQDGGCVLQHATSNVEKIPKFLHRNWCRGSITLCKNNVKFGYTAFNLII